jgi:AraC-like DNA-binding protein
MSVMSQELQAIDKQALALKLRQAGTSYEEIAQVVGYRSASGAYNAVRSAMKKTLQEPADELRRVELARLDAAQAGIWSKVLAGDIKSIHAFLKISERRSRLLGLDAPVVLDGSLNVNHTVSLEDMERIRAERWASIREQLAELPAPSPVDAIEVDMSDVMDNSHEKVTPD